MGVDGDDILTWLIKALGKSIESKLGAFHRLTYVFERHRPLTITADKKQSRELPLNLHNTPDLNVSGIALSESTSAKMYTD